MTDPLATYLHDHLAGSHFAVELLDSLHKQHGESELGQFALTLRAEVKADQDTLEKIINNVGTSHLDLKAAAGWLGDKVGQLKLRGDASGRLAAEAALKGYEGTFPEAQLLAETKNLFAELAETRAWTLFAQGDTDAAVALLSLIANRQDKVGKGEAELPAREMMGDMLRLANRPDASIREYRISLETDFGRFNTLLHAGEDAENLGLRDQATRYYRLLLSNASDPAPQSKKVLNPARAGLEAR
jgi:tetratricopeptide (TPR) repeat protein